MTLRREEKTLVILARKDGIDMRLTDLRFGQMLDANERLSVSMQRPGDLVAEYHYLATDTSVHQRVCSIAHSFSTGQPISEDAWTKVGISRKAWAAAQLRGADMRGVYDGISHGEGEPIYLEGGETLYPDGTIRRD